MSPSAGVEKLGAAALAGPEGRHAAHDVVLRLIPECSRVLQVGASGGSVAAALECGSLVWRVVPDTEVAAQSAAMCARVRIGDADRAYPPAALVQEGFDWILLLDVLGHLDDPLTALRSWLPLLAPDGHVLISLPNIAHASTRLQLLGGRLGPTAGAADAHFFDEASTRDLLASARLNVEEELVIRRVLEQPEIEKRSAGLSPELVRAVLSDPMSDVEQFLLVARSAQARNGRDAKTTPGATGRQGTATLRRAKEHTGSLEPETTTRDTQIAKLSLRAERVEELETVLHERMGELRMRDNELKHLLLELGLKERLLVELRGQLTAAEAETSALSSEREQLRGACAQSDSERARLQSALEGSAPLCAQIAALEQQVGGLEARLRYGRYRAADRVSAAAKRAPSLHRIARWVVLRWFEGSR